MTEEKSLRVICMYNIRSKQHYGQTDERQDRMSLQHMRKLDMKRE